MNIAISQILGRNGTSMSFSVSEKIEDITGYPDIVDFLEPVKIEGILTNVDDTIVLDAKGEVGMQIPCSRCLAPVKVQVNFNCNEKFSHAGVLNEKTETFSGDCIDLADIVKRSIISVLPMKVLCTQECKGLCPSCGKNLNEGKCDCDTTEFDPRFESLRALFKVDEEV